MPDRAPLTIVVADGHARYRERLAAALAAAPGLTVLAQVRDGDEALAAAVRLRPDLLVIDAGTHGADGYAVSRMLARDGGATSVVILAASPSAALGDEALEAGARGLLPKDLPRSELVDRIAALARVV